MMTDEEFRELKVSIEKNGQREPIALYQEKIIDGRNRYNACVELGMVPEYEIWDEQGSLLEYVKDKNLNRRQLNEVQKGMIAAKMRPLYEAEAKERQKLSQAQPGEKIGSKVSLHGNPPIEQKGKSTAIVGKMVGVGMSTVERAVRILNHGVPELIKLADDGQISARMGEQISNLPASQQPLALDEYRKRKESPFPRGEYKTQKKEDIKQKNAEWLAKNSTGPETAEETELKAMVDDVVNKMSEAAIALNQYVASMSDASNALVILYPAKRAVDVFRNDIDLMATIKEGVK